MNNIYTKYADVLINYSLGLKKGDKLLISSNYPAEPLLIEAFKKALEAGAYPDLSVGINGVDKIFYDNANNDQLQYISPRYEYAVKNYDAFLNIRSEFNLRELENTDLEKIKIFNEARSAIKKIFLKRASSNELRWVLCQFPTDAGAQNCGMSKFEYEDFIFNACYLNEDDPVAKWTSVSKFQEKIINFLNTKKIINYKSKDVDITFSCKGRKWINSDGKRNMPSGEVFTSPVEDSVNGKVRFSFPGIFMSKEIEDISLEIKKGEVIAWDAKKGRDLLDKVFEIPGARRFGEVAVGTNNMITKFTKNMLFDEKIGGTIHMALGASYPETGGINESSIHWDLLADMKDGGEIYADEELIYKNGKFII